MSDNNEPLFTANKKPDVRTNPEDLANPRRKFLAQMAFLGAGVAGAVALPGCKDNGNGTTNGTTATGKAAAGQPGTSKTHVGPGQLDDYYGFWSGGQSG